MLLKTPTYIALKVLVSKDNVAHFQIQCLGIDFNHAATLKTLELFVRFETLLMLFR